MFQQAFSAKQPQRALPNPLGSLTGSDCAIEPVSTKISPAVSVTGWDSLVAQLGLPGLLTPCPFPSPSWVQSVSFDFDNAQTPVPANLPADPSPWEPLVAEDQTFEETVDTLMANTSNSDEERYTGAYPYNSHDSYEDLESEPSIEGGSPSDEDFEPRTSFKLFRRESRVAPETAEEESKRLGSGRRNVADSRWTAEELKMSTVDFHRYIKNCSYSAQEIDELKRARRRKSNRKFARVSRNRKLHVDLPVESDDEATATSQGNPLHDAYRNQLIKKEKKFESLAQEIQKLRQLVASQSDRV